LVGKRSRPDVQKFSLRVIDNIFELHRDIVNKTYKHGSYYAFNISDPKPRNIHKASVRDRLLHHAIYRVLYPFFDRTFISDSFSCRVGKGTHKAMDRFKHFARIVSKNNTHTCWVLKCDIKKFFANIDHEIMIGILERYISDKDILWLLTEVIKSFKPGLPLGNLTSQLLVNVYMNEFDRFVKHRLKARYYIRYADDFVFLSQDKKWLENQIAPMEKFLAVRLKLELHPGKISIKTLASGVDFLGWVHFPHHRVPRTSTKRRMFEKLATTDNPQSKTSYLGLLSHGNTYRLQQRIRRLK